MPDYALIEDGRVTRMVTQAEKPAGSKWREAGDGCRLGRVLEGDTFVPPPRYAGHEQALAGAEVAVRAASDATMAAATEHASAWEMATWPGKLAAARAWEGGSADAEARAQLDAVGGPRGLDRPAAAALILAKAGRFQVAAMECEAIRVAGLAALAAVDRSQPLSAYESALEALVAGIDWTLGG